MTTPPRLRDATSDAPDALRTLLQHAARPAPMTELETARLDRELRRSAAGGGRSADARPSRRRWAALAAALVVAAGASAAVGWWLGVVGGRAPEAAPTSQGLAPSSRAGAQDGAPVAAPAPTEEDEQHPSGASALRGTSPSEPSGAARDAAGSSPRKPAAPGSRQGATEDPLERELAYLNQAQAALATDPARALQLTRQHAAEFPRGQLAVERELLAIDALVRSGQTEAAQKRAERFRARFGGGAYEVRLRTLLGER
jgi:hypothetical protein